MKMTMDQPVGFLRCDGAARYCGISVRTLAQWQADKVVPYAKMSHRVCLFKISDLDKAIARLTVNAAGG